MSIIIIITSKWVSEWLSEWVSEVSELSKWVSDWLSEWLSSEWEIGVGKWEIGMSEWVRLSEWEIGVSEMRVSTWSEMSECVKCTRQNLTLTQYQHDLILTMGCSLKISIQISLHPTLPVEISGFFWHLYEAYQYFVILRYFVSYYFFLSTFFVTNILRVRWGEWGEHNKSFQAR